MRTNEHAVWQGDSQPRSDEQEQSAPAARWLTEPEGMAVVRCYGIPFPASEITPTSPSAVLAAANRVGYPVVLKIVSPDILHKTDAGAVATGIDGPEALFERLDQMLRAVDRNVPGARLEGVLVAAEAPVGAELIIGARRDPQFGPVVAVGLGGTLVELLSDVSLKLAPISAVEAAEMVDETHVGALLAGLRGSPPLDRVAVEQLLVSVSQLVADRDDLLELDLNPVRVFSHGLMALDVRLRVGCGAGTMRDEVSAIRKSRANRWGCLAEALTAKQVVEAELPGPDAARTEEEWKWPPA